MPSKKTLEQAVVKEMNKAVQKYRDMYPDRDIPLLTVEDIRVILDK